MTTPQGMLELADKCELYSKIIEGITVVADDWKPGDPERQEPRTTLLKAAAILRQAAAQGQESAPCAWTGYLPDENGNLVRRWGFGRGPIDARDVRLLYSFPAAAAPQGREALEAALEKYIRPLPEWASEDDWNAACGKVFGALPARSTCEPDISHEDICLLSRVWNEQHNSAHGADYRINEWLKQQIALALTPAVAPDAGAGEITDEMLNAHLKATDEWCEPYPAEYEEGTQISLELCQEDADHINAEQRASLRKGYAAALAQEPGEALPTPFAWVLPGDDTAKGDGWIDARINEWSEFTKPLYAAPPNCACLKSGRPPPQVDSGREAVIEECAKIADYQAKIPNSTEVQRAHIYSATAIAKAIRALALRPERSGGRGA